MDRFSTFDAALGVDLRDLPVEDGMDLDWLADETPQAAFEVIGGTVACALADREAAILLGGDNSITRPGVHSLEQAFDRIGLLTLDAHHDLRDTTGGMTNGNPVRALLEDGLPGRNIVQIGIQSFANSKEYSRVAQDAGIHVVTAEETRAGGIKLIVQEALAKLEQLSDAIYVDLDVDVLDRAFAPACPGSRPGGLTPAEVQQAARLCGAHPKVRAMDVVEVDPTRDVAEATAMAAASFVLAFAAGLATRSGAV